MIYSDPAVSTTAEMEQSELLILTMIHSVGRMSTPYKRFLLSVRTWCEGCHVTVYGDRSAGVSLDHFVSKVELILFSRNGLHPNVRRWQLYSSYLSRNKHFKLVIVADARDTVFQCNPFQIQKLLPSTPFIFLTREDFDSGNGSTYTVGLNSFNSKRISSCLGKSIAGSMSEHIPVCAGYVFGNVVGMFQLSKAISAIHAHYCPQNMKVGDQGIVNYIAFSSTKRDFGMTVHTFDNGWPVFHLGLLGLKSYRRKGEHLFQRQNGTLILHSGEKPCACHHTDRYLSLIGEAENLHFFQ